MINWDVLAIGLIAIVLVVLGGLTGCWLATITYKRREHIREEQEAARRARVIHDTKRVSVARPGTKPGRISKATIDMSASNMGQSEREV